MDPIGAIRAFGASLLDLLVPRRCAGCLETWQDHAGRSWCGRCWDGLPWIRSPQCPVCGHPYLDSPSAADHLCGPCLLVPPAFDGARSATLYSGEIRKRIHEVKFGGQLVWIPPLAELLMHCWTGWNPASADGLVPVPLHVRRVRERGFNQAALLANAMGRRLRLPVHHDVLTRFRWTEPQTRLKREDRLRNVADAFQVANRGKARNRSLLLIDDVFTTGSTVAACAGALRDAGALRIYVLTVARSLPGWKPAERDV